jgi:uncharacterized membrane protein YedE/YeeE
LYHYLCQTIVPNIRSFVLATFNGIGLTNAKQKTPSSLGLLGRYDGNILGGCMIGLGMTLTGACPGTVLVPLSIGTRSGWYVMAGGVLVDILHTRILSLRKNDTNSSYDTNLTVYGRLGVKSQYATLVYGLFCVVLICAVSVLGPNEAFILLATIVGGALIGAAQAASLILTGAPVGVSTGYGVLGSYFWRTWESLSGQKSGKAARSIELGRLCGRYCCWQLRLRTFKFVNQIRDCSRHFTYTWHNWRIDHGVRNSTRWRVYVTARNQWNVHARGLESYHIHFYVH